MKLKALRIVGKFKAMIEMEVLATDIISILIYIIMLLVIVNFTLYFWIRKNELAIEQLKRDITHD